MLLNADVRATPPHLAFCFENEAAARQLVESYLWPDGVVCPHCGEGRRTGVLRGPSTSSGTHKCYRCRKLFTARSGTLFECSHVPLHKWLKALFLTQCGTLPARPFHLSQAISVSFKTAALMIQQIGHAAEECGLRAAAISDELSEMPHTYGPFMTNVPLQAADRTALIRIIETDAEAI